MFNNTVIGHLFIFLGEANAIIAKAKARAEGIQRVSLSLQEKVFIIIYLHCIKLSYGLQSALSQFIKRMACILAHELLR